MRKLLSGFFSRHKNWRVRLSFSLILNLIFLSSLAEDKINSNPSDFPQRLLEAAREVKASQPVYDIDRKYYKISYPNGDVPAKKGVCTDFVIRAFRKIGYDLQELVYKDMQKNFSLYPSKTLWGMEEPDYNIDHRRVANLAVFFKRFGQSLTLSAHPDSLVFWQPGDVIIWDLCGTGKENHIGIISDQKNSSRIPKVLHHRPTYPTEDDVLTGWPILGHYRFPKLFR